MIMEFSWEIPSSNCQSNMSVVERATEKVKMQQTGKEKYICTAQPLTRSNCVLIWCRWCRADKNRDKILPFVNVKWLPCSGVVTIMSSY